MEETLTSVEKLLVPCADFNPKVESVTIKLVSSDYGTLLYLPKILEKLKMYPLIKLEVYSPQEQDLNKLKEEDVDLYIGIGKISFLPETLYAKKSIRR